MPKPVSAPAAEIRAEPEPFDFPADTEPGDGDDSIGDDSIGDDSAGDGTAVPTPGQIVHVRTRRYLVEAVDVPRRGGEQSLVTLSCLDDDAQGEPLAVHARRLVAQRCLYGVDKNHFAVSLAKLSLWLVTLASDHPFTFVDHALRLGDSLVGLSREQILALDWEVGEQLPMVRNVVDPALAEAEEKRRRIQELGDLPDNADKRRLLREADVALGDVRLMGDLVIAAFFGAGKAKQRKELRSKYESKVSHWQGKQLDGKELTAFLEVIESGEFPSRLDLQGKEYDKYRSRLMIQDNEGLTTTYNRFHDPEERDPGILRLRELHDQMDRAVLDAYGWHDIRPTCEFLLDYEVEDDEPGQRRKKKPWRYRWPDEVRDDVLGRLLELNEKRAKEERRRGMEAKLASGKAKKDEAAAKPSSGNLPLFGDDEG